MGPMVSEWTGWFDSVVDCFLIIMVCCAVCAIYVLWQLLPCLTACLFRTNVLMPWDLSHNHYLFRQERWKRQMHRHDPDLFDSDFGSILATEIVIKVVQGM